LGNPTDVPLAGQICRDENAWLTGFIPVGKATVIASRKGNRGKSSSVQALKPEPALLPHLTATVRKMKTRGSGLRGDGRVNSAAAAAWIISPSN
jgi:hypothetical protein